MWRKGCGSKIHICFYPSNILINISSRPPTKQVKVSSHGGSLGILKIIDLFYVSRRVTPRGSASIDDSIGGQETGKNKKKWSKTTICRLFAAQKEIKRRPEWMMINHQSWIHQQHDFGWTYSIGGGEESISAVVVVVVVVVVVAHTNISFDGPPTTKTMGPNNIRQIHGPVEKTRRREARRSSK